MTCCAGGRGWAVVARVLLALVVASACVLTSLSPAWGYYVFGTVEVATGATQVSLAAGSSTLVSVTVTPASDDQTLGCGMAKCPQECTSPSTVDSGYSCFDVNGNCTCAGTAYSTYYPELRVSSSNSAVASAVVSGNAVTITGNSAGEAIITVTASLRQWTSNSTAISVTVSASEDGAESSTSISNAQVDLPEEAVAGSADDEADERVIDTVAGRVYAVKITSSLDTASYLSRIAGTNDQVVFWSGAAYETPAYSWTFTGDAVDANSSYLSFDPTITVSSLGTGEVANILMQAQDGVVLEFSHTGWLPGEASVYVRVDDVYVDGTKLNLYSYSDSAKSFGLASENLTVAGGYTSFSIDHCSSWAVSMDDLSIYKVEETNTPGASAAAIGQGNSAAVIAAAIAVVCLAAVVIAIVLVRCRAQHAHAMRAQDAGISEGDGALSSEVASVEDAKDPGDALGR